MYIYICIYTYVCVCVCVRELRGGEANQHQYHIGPPLSRFALKGIAGNIIHAVSTTNAIAAGLIVLEALKVYSSSTRHRRT